MKNILSQLDKDVQKRIKLIAGLADEKKMPAYVVGGIVRDALLKKPSKDIDVVFEGDALSIASVCARKWDAKIIIHQQFGTAALRCPDGSIIDFVTARKETYRSPGALPQVQFSVLLDDLYRRDFTINSMAVVINKDGYGRLIDCFDGLNDLRDKKIRAHHQKSFIDDATRILRAIRFEQRFCFKMERNTLQWIKNALKQKKEKTIKAPRYFAEFQKFFSESLPAKCLSRLKALGGMGFTEVKDVGVTRRLNDIEIKLRRYKQKDHLLSFYLMVLYEKETISGIERFSKKVSLNKNVKKHLMQLVKMGDVLKNISVKKISASQIFNQLRSFDDEVLLYFFYRSKSAIIRKRINQFLLRDKFVTLKIAGQDCTALGVSTGKKMGSFLSEVLNQKIDTGFKTKNQELKALNALINKK